MYGGSLMGFVVLITMLCSIRSVLPSLNTPVHHEIH